MRRRDFLRDSVAAALAAELGRGKAQAKVPAHNWGHYDFGSGPTVLRLYEGVRREETGPHVPNHPTTQQIRPSGSPVTLPVRLRDTTPEFSRLSRLLRYEDSISSP